MTTTKLCPVQLGRWRETDRSRALLMDNHKYSVGKDTSPVFARLDTFWAKRPTSNVTHFEGTKQEPACACGSPSAWSCYSKVYTHILLGQERVYRTGRGFTVYPGDSDINAEILGIANKYIPSSFVNGIPCEEFRDLCNELVLSLSRFTDGTVSTWYLPQIAAAYRRREHATQSVTTSRLRKPNYNKRITNV